MYIGRLLLERGWVDPDALARGLAEQRLAGTRICSLLIGRGQLDPDTDCRLAARIFLGLDHLHFHEIMTEGSRSKAALHRLVEKEVRMVYAGLKHSHR